MHLIPPASKRKLIKEIALMLQSRPKVIIPFTKLPIAKQLSRFYVAGDTISDAIAVVKKLKAEGKMSTIDFLGEDVQSRSEAHSVVTQYLRLIDAIADNHLGRYADASLKLTQLGLNIDKDFCINQLSKIIRRGNSLAIGVWVDMEDHRYTDATVEIVESLRPKYPFLRAVLQSMMKSSNAHAERLVKLGTTIRLCKGAYKEPPEYAYQNRLGDIRTNFLKIIDETLFREPLFYHGIATHDEVIIQKTIELAEKHGVPKNDFEFQMLYGVKKDLQDALVRKGYRLRIYVPYGKHWLPYFLRRIGENPDIVDDFARGMIEQLLHRK